ncbi:hypothetical protein CesoFtcFv8_013342 [Champsocephalus esox]|uniref:Uncharacterized protein n=2 Tax=Champsocephalus TaxID=52236 RepID=A0AAN8DDN8_CHAGU|nr:hypothetical protein CesoFtcFv8_013342 [Champsocephalus esox]KAK5920270.1 hypothetical protein CgunFtcFv8_024097 [Champsocephalus gunnari]
MGGPSEGRPPSYKAPRLRQGSPEQLVSQPRVEVVREASALRVRFHRWIVLEKPFENKRLNPIWARAVTARHTRQVSPAPGGPGPISCPCSV